MEISAKCFSNGNGVTCCYLAPKEMLICNELMWYFLHVYIIRFFTIPYKGKSVKSLRKALAKSFKNVCEKIVYNKFQANYLTITFQGFCLPFRNNSFALTVQDHTHNMRNSQSKLICSQFN